MERNVLSRFQRIDVDTKIPDVKRFTKPTTALEPYAVTPGEDTKRKSQALLAWVTVPTGASFQQLAMKVLPDVLINNPGSPLPHALLHPSLPTPSPPASP